MRAESTRKLGLTAAFAVRITCGVAAALDLVPLRGTFAGAGPSFSGAFTLNNRHLQRTDR